MIDCIEKIVDIAVKAGGLFLAIYTLWYNKDAIFKNTLHNKQLEELEVIRRTLHDIWSNICDVKLDADAYKSLSDFEKELPEGWQRYCKYKADSMSLRYKLSSEKYYLFPKWFDYSKVRDLYDEMTKYAPFTVLSLRGKSLDEIKVYQDLIMSKIGYLDEILKRKS